LLAFLAGRAIPGVEEVHGRVYRRTARIGPHAGVVEAELGGDQVELRIDPALARVVAQVVARIRAVLDVDARPDRIVDRLGGDPALGERVRARPGLRVPGAFDPFELAVRAVLGQQVSVRAATTLSGRLVERFGSPLEDRRLFPSAAELAAVPVDDLRGIGLPEARARTIASLARAVAEDRVDLQPDADPASTVAALVELPGIGPWTAQYVAMRALRWPDAFPAGDLAVKKALGATSAKQAEALAERWRPWRAYAVMHLWTGGGGG
jgi:AraC family transcriptional regulator of adaptative response / DNA-3-methyladenine glycosylase II